MILFAYQSPYNSLAEAARKALEMISSIPEVHHLLQTMLPGVSFEQSQKVSKDSQITLNDRNEIQITSRNYQNHPIEQS